MPIFKYHDYKKIAYVGGCGDNPDAISRKKIVWDIAKKMKVPIPENYFYEGDFLIESGKTAVKEILDEETGRDNPPSQSHNSNSKS